MNMPNHSTLSLEQDIVSGILRKPDLVHDIPRLPLDAFQFEQVRVIYEAILGLVADNKPIAANILLDRLRKNSTLETVGGKPAVDELLSRSVSQPMAEAAYSAIVENKQARDLEELGADIVKGLSDDRDSFKQVYEDAQRRLTEIGVTKDADNTVTMNQAMVGVVAEAERILTNPEECMGVRSGFQEFDKCLFGFHPGELTVLAARPSVGKSSIALTFLRNAAIQGHPILLFTLEMTTHDQAWRLFAQETGFSKSAFREGSVTKSDLKSMMNTVSEHQSSNTRMLVNDEPSLSIETIKRISRRYKRTHGIEMIAVDYIQLAKGSSRATRKDLEIGEITGGLKTLAKELSLPVIGLSQLNRKVDADTQPTMNQLRESGAIEQDADNILFLWREHEKTKLHIEKARNGVRDVTFNLKFKERETDFMELGRAAKP